MFVAITLNYWILPAGLEPQLYIQLEYAKISPWALRVVALSLSLGLFEGTKKASLQWMDPNPCRPAARASDH